jgi:hypothetical protein
VHEWRAFFGARKCWSLMDNSILYLGANRFCVGKLINIYNGVPG